MHEQILPMNSERRRHEADHDGRKARPDILDSVANGDTPAMATDQAGHVLVWNRGMEKLLGRPAKEALGRRCFEVMGGRDVFGNRYCHENCAILCMSRKGEAVQGFEMTVAAAPRAEVPVQVTVLEVPVSGGDERAIVHLLQPIDPEARRARSLERLNPSDVPGARTCSPVLAGGRDPLSPCPLLTRRENEVLQFVAAGLQNKEVAQELGISVATTRNHIHNVLEKLDVHSKLEAVSLAFREGWVTGSSRAERRGLERLA